MTNPRRSGPKCALCKRALPTKEQRAAAVLRQQMRRLRHQPPAKGTHRDH